MIAYLVRRIPQMAPVLFLISLFVFFLVRLVPGDPATILLGQRATDESVAQVRRELGLDQPIWVQYGIFLRDALQGDLGQSARMQEPVMDILLDRLPSTLFLASYAIVLTVIITVPLAAWAALNKGRWPDHLVRGFVLISLAMPAYWIGMMFLQFFAVRFRIFPVAGYGEGLFGHITSLFLPALTLALAIASVSVRSLRNSILETTGSDYIRTARAKGLSSYQVFVWHILRNSALSTVTILGVNFAFLIGGTAIVETIFAIPGLGQLIIRAVFDRDYAVIQGVTLAFGAIVLMVNLLTDLCYAALDPRVKLR